MTLTPGRRKALALLLGWVSVSLVLFMLARPVREWAGHHWLHYVVAAVVLAGLGCTAAVGLWPRE